MKSIKSIDNFIEFLDDSLDVYLLRVEGEPHHSMVQVEAYLDYDKQGVFHLVSPGLCCLNDFIDNSKNWDNEIYNYVSEFTHIDVDFDPNANSDDIIRAISRSFDLDDRMHVKTDRFKDLYRLKSGLYLVGFVA